MAPTALTIVYAMSGDRRPIEPDLSTPTVIEQCLDLFDFNTSCTMPRIESIETHLSKLMPPHPLSNIPSSSSVVTSHAQTVESNSQHISVNNHQQAYNTAEMCNITLTSTPLDNQFAQQLTMNSAITNTKSDTTNDNNCLQLTQESSNIHSLRHVTSSHQHSQIEPNENYSSNNLNCRQQPQTSNYASIYPCDATQTETLIYTPLEAASASSYDLNRHDTPDTSDLTTLINEHLHMNGAQETHVVMAGPGVVKQSNIRCGASAIDTCSRRDSSVCNHDVDVVGDFGTIEMSVDDSQQTILNNDVTQDSTHTSCLKVNNRGRSSLCRRNSDSSTNERQASPVAFSFDTRSSNNRSSTTSNSSSTATTSDPTDKCKLTNRERQRELERQEQHELTRRQNYISMIKDLETKRNQLRDILRNIVINSPLDEHHLLSLNNLELWKLNTG
ncbi:hypothetical protein GZH46_01553 [Fragariocoptes setiger]|uniref:Uncharacterized protein n=1 Tax=Fragariocoptes setiger TaxID=1670756 RepID=A0ABQ7S963_9ACAR|nr:hypothetical protein GZH46_01553 [Fragariocoptes setiger]